MTDYKDSGLYNKVGNTNVYASDGSKTSYSGKTNRIDDALIYLANNIGGGGGGVITNIDDALSVLSENAVQNKAIAIAIDNVKNQITWNEVN